ncbi:MAG: FAD-dependent oxidoreductase [Aquabacterium sp.]
MSRRVDSDVLVVGGGLAGLVTALECLRAGQRVTLVDRDTPDRLGGLAWWAFGGMALVGTPLQKRMRIRDTPEIAWRDWLRFGELPEADVWPRAWARHYVEHSRTEVHDWLVREGVKFMPAVNWVERGMYGEGNSVPRYHVVWGTARELVRVMVAALRRADTAGRLTVLHRHRVTALTRDAGCLSGAVAVHEDTGEDLTLRAPAVVLAMGGINGSTEMVRAHWPVDRPMPSAMLNGAHPYSDGLLHQWVNKHCNALRHPCRRDVELRGRHPAPLSAFRWPWAVDHSVQVGACGWIIGGSASALSRWSPASIRTICVSVWPRWRCPHTWHLLNWRIACKEFAISGAEHNPSIRDKRILRFAMETLFGNARLVRQMVSESRHVLADDTLAGLARKMNALTGTHDIQPEVLQATVDAFDANFQRGHSLHNDDQIRRILHARQWPADRLRTCQPAPMQRPGDGPFIAMQMQFITRKSLGGLQTDLQSRVLDHQGQAIDGLYCVGEAAGFGGGGANGKRSLEGTFLPGCILTARAAARGIITGRAR